MNYEQVCEYYRQRLGYTDDEDIAYELEHTAHHEAGHFVMNMAFDALPRTATVLPDAARDYLGSVGNSVCDWRTLHLLPPDIARRTAAAGMLVTFAGSVGAEIYGFADLSLVTRGPEGEAMPEREYPSDGQMIQKYLNGAFDPAEHDSVRDALYRLTWDVMERRGTFNAVGVVAVQLLHHITLDGDQIYATERRARRHLRLHHVQVATMIDKALATLK